VAAIVTSRTVVADRARYPAGTVALQLQPFTDDQVRQWLEVWNRHNAALLADRGLRQLTLETALSHVDLVRQPLLLLMLAIFDANANALRQGTANLSKAELYEALLQDFASREIQKSPQSRSLPQHAQQKLAEAELERLAVVALAMFARGRQAATEAELNQDLPILLPEQDAGDHDDDGGLSPAQHATGRFFFIHKSEARTQGQRAHSYEFLHTTFGEFLIAWLTSRALGDLLALREVLRTRSRMAGDRLDDGFMYSILSFACFAERAPIINFLGELLGRLSPDERARAKQLLLALLKDAHYPHPSRSYPGYEPIRHPLTRRLAVYSANLTTLLVLLAPDEITVGEIFADPDGPAASVEHWVRHNYLWKAQLSSSEWNGLVGSIRVRVNRTGEDIKVALIREDRSPVSVHDSFIISAPGSVLETTDYDILVSHSTADSYDLHVPADSDAGMLIRKMAFLPNWRMGMLFIQAIPFFKSMGHRVRWHNNDESSLLPAYLLAQLDYNRDVPPGQRVQYYEACLSVMSDFPDLERQILIRLNDDVHNLPAATMIDLLRRINDVRPSDGSLDVINALWSRLSANAEARAVGGRDLVIALVKAINQRWPDTDLGRLAPRLRIEAATKSRSSAVG
jgi:hypothetical protein